MSGFVRAFSSSIGKKQVMAVTGLALCVFLVFHLLGNLLLFLGPEIYDAYAAGLEDKPWILIPLEVGLLAVFVLHVYLGVRVTVENRRARRSRYVVRGNRGAEDYANTTMGVTGVFTLVFIIFHLINFKFGVRPDDSLYWLVVETFHDPAYLAWYILSMCVLGLHLYHGVQSAFRSLGLQSLQYERPVARFSQWFAVAIAVGYASLPIYAFAFVDISR